MITHCITIKREKAPADSVTVNVTLTQEEQATIEALAKRAGVSVPELLKAALLRRTGAAAKDV